MNAFKNQKAHNLYTNKQLWKSLMIIIVPCLLMNLMVGIYYFTNQVLIVRLVPFAHGNASENFTYWFGSQFNYQEIKDLIQANNLTQANKLDFYDVSDVVRGAISISIPIATIIGTSPFFITGGATVLFSQSLGMGNKTKAQQVFKTSFWMVAAFSAFEMLILLAINQPLLNVVSSPVEHTTNETLNAYYQRVHDLQIEIAKQQTIVYSSELIIPMFVSYFGSLIRSEGKFKIVMMGNVMCNIINIGLTILFILVVKMDAYSASVSTLVCHFINLAILMLYLTHLNSKNNTWLEFQMLYRKGATQFKRNLINPIILIGLSAFLIDLSFSIANIFFIPILAQTAANPSIFSQAHGNGMYFQTIEGAVMPILNLTFIAIYGIIDGGRLIVAYNYSQGNWKRIKKIYRDLILISLICSIIILLITTIALGHQILHLFNIPNEMMHNAYLVLVLENAMILIFCFQASAMAIYMAIGDIARSNISAIFQDIITFFPVLGICVGLTYATNDIWILVACYVINAFVATTLMTIYTIWWVRRRLGHIKLKISNKHGKPIKMWFLMRKPSPSLVQLALTKL